MFVVVVVFLFALSLCYTADGDHTIKNNDTLKNTDIHNCRWKRKSDNVQAFWLNLEKNKDRALYMESQLTRIGLPHHRIEAIMPDSPEYLVDLLEQPCKRNTPRDIAVILSHLKAMYTAVHSTEKTGSLGLSDYALILEDDVKFLYDIDFSTLIQSAPADFGILQLVTSNMEAINSLLSQFKSVSTVPTTTTVASANGLNDKYWKKTAWNHFTKNGKTSLYWSAQAYLINKKVIKPFLDDVITLNSQTGKLHYKIVNSFFPKNCKRTSTRPCILSNCLFADSYIFSGGEPTYISTIPLFSGAKVGFVSTIHQEQVSFHQDAFALIKSITHDLMKSNSSRSSGSASGVGDVSVLPSFVRLPECL